MTYDVNGESASEHGYSTHDLCVEFGVTARTLRFYDQKKLLRPERVGRSRMFSRRDRVRLQLILRGKRHGFTLLEIKDMLEIYDRHQDELSYMQVMLPKLQLQLHALEKERGKLDGAIADLQQYCQQMTETLSQQPVETNVKQAGGQG